ncbi:hypothetical protein BA768_10540 [Chryseobacterium sp. CBo1]|uniref:helix-turn-helix transcriptional regulator n=1 Tax=Chryseobacterium sp. CBo1 TaxID=1869230 RepID=UPI000810EF95|nr:helix-turn-helix transcriptional regulator [Chryseobacterium sp. CBo1]OCK52804.1 hypothetical protein BA768_10540 [Chryseobacterium sp. CBo1]
MKKEKLIGIRKGKKISQTDIATYLKISQTQYQKRESGKIKITDLEWQRIAQLLEVFVEDIYEEDFLLNNQEDIRQELQSLKEKIKVLEQKLRSFKTTSTAAPSFQ